MTLSTSTPRLLRRRFFVKRGLQGRLILGIVAAAVLSFLLVMADYYVSFGRNAGWDLDMLEVFLKSQKLPMFQLVVFVFVLVFVTLVLSHRVAGPLVNLERSLDRAGTGDLTHTLRLRPKDELKDIRDAYNRMIGRLRDRVLADRRKAGDIHRVLERVEASPDLSPEDKKEIRAALDQLVLLTRDFIV